MPAPADESVVHLPGILHILQERAEEAERRGLSRLATLLEHADAVELFVATATSIMFGLPEELAEAQDGAVS